jgi:alcohol dehydrogenase
MTKYRALFVEEAEDKNYTQALVERSIDDLPKGEILIRVEYSSLNFKDALSAHGNKGVTRQFPHQPGIDAAGTVEQSNVDAFAPGDSVIVTGYDLGMNTAGGLGQYIRVPASWVIPCPTEMNAKQAMHFGTAGLTAQLCINKLEKMGLTPSQGKVLVTGASGGVGSIAVALLAHAGYEVVASTGKLEQTDYLQSIGAKSVIDRANLQEESKRPLGQADYAAAIDVAGGVTLANVLKSVKHSGSVAACGLVENPNYPGSVFPHILRNVNLLGVDSVEIPLEEKRTAWEQLAMVASLPALAALNQEIRLDDVIGALASIVKGNATRHLVVNMT